jgi:hypothetical protein
LTSNEYEVSVGQTVLNVCVVLWRIIHWDLPPLLCLCPFKLDQIKDSGFCILNSFFQNPCVRIKNLWADALLKSFCLCEFGSSPYQLSVPGLGLFLKSTSEPVSRRDG